MAEPSSRGRYRIRLVDLLVVMAIIIVFMGLLLPLIQSVRQAEGRSQTCGNLMQLGLAVNNLMGVTHGKVPPAYGACGTSKDASLFYYLLPYLEAQNITASRGVTDTEAPPLKMLEAPLDSSNPGGTGLTSYASNASLFGGSATDPTHTPMVEVNVIEFYMTKGSTNLLLFAERFASLNGVWSSKTCYFFGATEGSQIQFNVTPSTATAGASPGFCQAFESTGCNVSMGDGSVRRIDNVGANPTTNFVWACTPTTSALPTTDW